MCYLISNGCIIGKAEQLPGHSSRGAVGTDCDSRSRLLYGFVVPALRAAGDLSSAVNTAYMIPESAFHGSDSKYESCEVTNHSLDPQVLDGLWEPAQWTSDACR